VQNSSGMQVWFVIEFSSIEVVFTNYAAPLLAP